jgi:hypothetical protein
LIFYDILPTATMTSFRPSPEQALQWAEDRNDFWISFQEVAVAKTAYKQLQSDPDSEPQALLEAKSHFESAKTICVRAYERIRENENSIKKSTLTRGLVERTAYTEREKKIERIFAALQYRQIVEEV